MNSTTTAESDKAQISEIINLYGLALDAHRWDLFDQIFADDVVAEFGPAGTEWVGLPVLVAAFKDFHEQLDNHQHTMSSELVHIDGDRAWAFSYGVWLLVRKAAGEDPNWTGTGWYDDELVRTDRGWRIKHRVCRLVSWTGNPAVSSPERAHNPDMGTNVLRDHARDGRIGYLNALGSSASGSSASGSK
ncbi:MAG TPA: nuclear transport factor 2 family protein [Galbitalea sp.]|jgi:hypothetical protein|nr:nuclear transport factor 2 family protein [Galbitalea sp.]